MLYKLLFVQPPILKMANLTELVEVVRLQGETLAQQQLQMQAMQATSDNVWVLGRAFSVLTMVRLLICCAACQ